MTTEREDLVRRLRVILAAGHTAAYDLRNDIETELASAFTVPSSPEARRLALEEAAKVCEERAKSLRARVAKMSSIELQVDDMGHSSIRASEMESTAALLRALAARAAQGGGA